MFIPEGILPRTMKLKITDSRKITEIQEDFSRIFPFLKIEFFSRPHKVEGGTAREHRYHPSKTLGECRTIQKPGEISISPLMTVGELEQIFAENYGLSVQVFRKSGKVWLETTLTDQWTLEEQNKQGEALSRPVTLDKPEYDPSDD